MNEQIVMLAGELSGNEGGALLEAVSAAAIEYWKRRLKDGVDTEKCGGDFICAAAFPAAADLMTGQSGAAASFTAGEISVKGRGAAEVKELAGMLRQSAERMMAPYTTQADFVFRGVQG